MSPGDHCWYHVPGGKFQYYHMVEVISASAGVFEVKFLETGRFQTIYARSRLSLVSPLELLAECSDGAKMKTFKIED